jgi:hypothetical protein
MMTQFHQDERWQKDTQQLPDKGRPSKQGYIVFCNFPLGQEDCCCSRHNLIQEEDDAQGECRKGNR